MSQDYNNPAFKKLLQKLQEESWQLELLISGFAIFGLFTAFPFIRESAREAQNTQQIYQFVISTVGIVSCAILIFNLLLHVLLRGLWIGALGLRYVSGDIDYESLKYSPKFTNYLKKRVGSFDRYIATLENYCSIIFAISFLLIFYVLAITFTILAIALIANYLIDSDTLPGWISKGIGIPLMLFIIFGMLLSFFDFITQGFLKKKKWISRIYFPIYWLFSFVTLSFLYRPLVYNFLDNRFGKRVSFVLVPIYILILLATSLNYNESNYMRGGTSSSDYKLNNKNYEDIVRSNNRLIEDVVIQSKVITDPFVKVFIRYSNSVEDRIFNYNPSLKPDKDKRGLSSEIQFSSDFVNRRNRDSLRRVYLKTFNDIYSVTIDSTKYSSDFLFSSTKKEQLGFETYVGIDSLTEGKHLLKLSRKAVQKDGDTVKFTIVKIPFWYYKD